MQFQKIENMEMMKNFNFNQKMVNLNEDNYTFAMKDADIIPKFCGKPTIDQKNEETNDNSEPDSSAKIDVFQAEAPLDPE